MSWFDTSGIASLAKSALKEAQKTIDKALDIQDENGSGEKRTTNTPVTPTSAVVDPENFFATWGLNEPSPQASITYQQPITKSPTKSQKSAMSTSLWGSFTGSFFEPTGKDSVIGESSKDIEAESLADDSVNEIFNESKLVVEEIIDDRLDVDPDKMKLEENTSKNEIFTEIVSNIETLSNEEKLPPVIKRKEKSNSAYCNRLSIISSESGRNSSDSVEILGSSDTGCTSTPDSEMISYGHSLSTSSSGLRNSDSVEIIPDSLTSPSSIEVLSGNNTVNTDDEFLSPSSDLPEITDTSESISKVSPESIEVIPEDDDEETSNADDSISFTSFSESTMNTVLEQFQSRFEPHTGKLREMSESTPSDLSLSPDKSMSSFGEPITRPPSKTGMHLSLAHTTKDTISKEPLTTLIDTQPQVSNQSITALVESPNVINPVDEESGPDDGSLSDRTITASEGDPTTFMESSTETVTTNESSVYVKNMLADAMIEKANEKKSKTPEIIREQSPMSSESRSDLIKIESEHTSDHTSGDELETTTSSDIEIISSPNGDSSSTQSVSRQSPAKLFGFKGLELVSKTMMTKIKGHNRELSEASSHSDDSHLEVEKLLRRISEMTEILEAREAKLVDMNRQNMELAENNAELKTQLYAVHSKQLESADVNQVTEEYTQRMSALERKFQQAIRERDNLRKQMDALKQDSTRVSKSDLEVSLQEKDDIIKELREEGEKLSKTQLQQSNIIKKIRATEKETANEIKRLKTQLEEITTENERLKKSLSAKEKVERSQIEAIHQLTSKNNVLDRENSLLKSQLDDTTQRLETIKTSLDAAKKELSDKQNASHELSVREKALAEMETSKRITQSQNEEILNQLEDLRDKLRQTEQEYSRKEAALRDENNELLRRLENSEARNEELAESISQATKPLIRQLDSLQSTYSFKQNSWEKQEQELLDKLNEAQTSLVTLTENERQARQDCLNLRSRVSTLETNYNTALRQNDELISQIEELKTRRAIAENELQKQKEKYENELLKANEEIQRLSSEILALNQQLDNEKQILETEKMRIIELQDQLQQRHEPFSEQHSLTPQAQQTLVRRDSSPTLSLGRISLSESLGSIVWPQDDNLECGASASGRYSTVYDSIRGNPTAILENLQSTLKLRDGEIQQLQWEMSRRDNERTLLTNELALLTSKLEQLETHCANYDQLNLQFIDISQKYDAMCQMYGEKVEEVQELRLDLQDVKEMYKTQIDELLNKKQKDG
ncbi:TATA element modulatory factor [Chrysoperla carnea]|uniref:TATA element modulatory factor n=1 Tax=Chrysoperla carnea TaxID=189513 RepID=UPI001D067E3E|nr:TATA element modulatory factor [Chrysoperla carnea]